MGAWSVTLFPARVLPLLLPASAEVLLETLALLPAPLAALGLPRTTVLFQARPVLGRRLKSLLLLPSLIRPGRRLLGLAPRGLLRRLSLRLGLLALPVGSRLVLELGVEFHGLLLLPHLTLAPHLLLSLPRISLLLLLLEGGLGDVDWFWGRGLLVVGDCVLICLGLLGGLGALWDLRLLVLGVEVEWVFVGAVVVVLPLRVVEREVIWEVEGFRLLLGLVLSVEGVRLVVVQRLLLLVDLPPLLLLLSLLLLLGLGERGVLGPQLGLDLSLRPLPALLLLLLSLLLLVARAAPDLRKE